MKFILTIITYCLYNNILPRYYIGFTNLTGNDIIINNNTTNVYNQILNHFHNEDYHTIISPNKTIYCSQINSASIINKELLFNVHYNNYHQFFNIILVPCRHNNTLLKWYITRDFFNKKNIRSEMDNIIKKQFIINMEDIIKKT
jgi:hypothetical protein